MRRVLYLIGVLVLFAGFGIILNSCGGGAGDDYTPPGLNPGQPAELRLYPDRNVAQTGTYVTLRAFLYDANGRPVTGHVVNFTNLSIYGILSSTTATTDEFGVAKVNIRSTTDGIATVVAESSALRDRRSIVFTSNDTVRGLIVFPISVVVDVDGDGDGVYNEPDDLNMFQGAGDDTVLVRATVSVFGQVVSGVEVTFTADHPDAYFPDGTDTDDDGKGDYRTTYTDAYGQAYATVRIDPDQITYITTLFNVYAQTGLIYVPEFDNYFSGAGAVTLFLQPITVQRVDLYADPTVVNIEETSDLTVAVTLSTGGPAPDGTVVQISTTCGAIDKPFLFTENGMANATFTAPSQPGSCTVTATSGGVSDSVVITVVSDLVITGPATMNEVNDSATFNVSGGTEPYTITFTHDATSATPIFNEVSPVSGNSVTLTTNSDCTKIDQDTQVTITVTDVTGVQYSYTFTVLDYTGIVSPTSAEVCENDSTCSAGVDTVTFYFCGTTPYDVVSSDTNIIPDQTGLNTGTFDVDPCGADPGDSSTDCIDADTDVTLTVTDANSVSQDVVVTVINQ